MAGMHEILKKRLLDTIRSVSPPGKWKVVVVDTEASRILYSVCKEYDILEENVTLVETLEKPRQPYPQMEAIYILTPTYDAITRVIEDFAKHQTPLYACAHLFFTSALDDKLFQRLKNSPASQFVKKCTELYIDFQALEAQVYSFESPQSFFKLYSPKETQNYENEIRKLASQLLSVCASLGENPLIRYQRSLESDHPTKTLPYKLAMLLQNELDGYVKSTPDFPPRDNQRPRATLLIVDRTIDMFAPLLHEFTYQAMANDLLPIDNGQKYTYNYTGSDGQAVTKEAILDESDSVWVEIRHKHMKECIDKLMKDFNEFVGENSGFTDSDKAASLNDMKKMLATLPQFQNMKEKFSVHLNIAQECMGLFEKQKLAETANIEQNSATGSTPDGHNPKALVDDMVPLLDDLVVSSYDKVRMLLLYMQYKGGIVEEDRRKLLAHSGISLEENEAINNTVLLGVKLIRSPLGGDKAKKPKQKQSGDHQYDISRYVPQLKEVLESHINKSLDSNAYPYTKDPSSETDGGGRTTPAQAVSLRSARAGWYKKGQTSENRNSRLIVFVAGGATYSELRSAYELSEKHHIDVIIGSTHILTPGRFIDDLKRLRDPPAAIKVQTPPLPNRPSVPTSNYGAPSHMVTPNNNPGYNRVPSPGQGYNKPQQSAGYHQANSGYSSHLQNAGYQQSVYAQQSGPNQSYNQYQQPTSHKHKTTGKLGKEIGKFFK